MSNYDFVNFMSSIIVAYSIMLIAVILLRMTRYFREFNGQKKNSFTQDIIDKNRQNISNVMNKLNRSNKYQLEMNFIDGELFNTEIEEIIRVIYYFNSLANGISREIYSEDVVRATYEVEFKMLFRRYQPLIRELRFINDDDMLFFELENLIFNWEHNRTSTKSKSRGLF
ncbi:hypothetical protein U1P98_01105 [Lysinibacillus irui]|uniref:DUF4760 domain-containing protein n=1 Tax=Lysinibacillus irui TaxID=2998077 RepID=A0ABU5NFV9_9BACI|nr:hypothetical protein [Lysinibacillus irui]MEA0554182.1 hypothetical protein [Lysinibacillus irui]MEA0974876.1 hypothetical protein [Lysinibacillus irui]MEA1041030.1 hypothetical protein [Lysinibacillus irui]